MKKFMKKAFGCLAAAGLYLTLTAFPAMAQEEILINPNAVQKLKTSIDPYMGYSMEITAGEFFIGIPAEGCILTTLSDCMQKYHPDDWALVGKDDCYFNFPDGLGNSLYFHITPYSIDNYDGWPESEGLSLEQWRIVVERPVASHLAVSPNTVLYVTGDGPSGLDGIIAGITLINSAFPNGAAVQQPSQPALTPTGAWKQDAAGWWYDNGDGTWPAGGWKWIDGNHDGVAECYYFAPNGYLVTNGLTPDGHYVNQDGAWTENGFVQTQ